MAYTTQQLYSALEAADAAGNGDDARQIALMIQQQQQPPQTAGQTQPVAEPTPTRQPQPQGYTSNYAYVAQPEQIYQPQKVPTAAIIDAAAQGLTYGQSDELEGIGSAATSGFGEGYFDEFSKRSTKGRDVARARMTKHREQNPEAYAAAELLGGLASGGALFKGVNALTQAGNLGKVATGTANLLAALGEGALAGQGYSEAEFGSPKNITDTTFGGAIGFIGGAAGEILQRPIKAIVDRLTNVDAKDIVARELLAGKPDDISLEDYAADLKNRMGQPTGRNADVIGDTNTPTALPSRDEVRDPNMQAALADLPQLRGLAGDTGRAASPDLQIREALQDRVLTQQNRISDTADPRLQVGDVVAGRTLTNDDFINDLGLSELGRNDARNFTPESNLVYLGTDANATSGFAANARREGNAAARESYTKAYQSQPTNAQITKLRELSEKTPLIMNELRKASITSRNINVDTGGNVPTMVQLLDEASKSLGTQIRTAQRSGNADNKSISALIKNKRAIDQVALDIAPDLREARKLGLSGQQAKENIEAGYGGLGATEDASFGLRRSVEGQPIQQAQIALGAGRKVRELVEKGGRDSKTGKLLKANEIRNYNRIKGEPLVASHLEGLVSSEAIANDVANIANRDPLRTMDILKSSLPKNFKDIASMATFAGMLGNINSMMVSITSQRLGQSTVARLPRRKLAKRVQKEIYKLGATADDIDNLLLGNFNKIKPSTLAALVSGLPRLAGIEVTQDFAEQ